MDEAEDLKEIDQLIKKQKLEDQGCDELEYSEFIDDYDSDEYTGENEDYEIPDYQKQDVSKLSTYTPSSILTVSEKRIVDMCKDPDLKELLILNRQKNMQLMQFFKMIKDLLIECQTNIMQKDNQIKAKNSDKRNNYKIWRIGRPYFKSADNFPCPRNEDTVQKHQNGELLYYDMIPSTKWFNNDAKRLMAGVAFIYKVIREEELTNQIYAVEQSDNVDPEELKMLKQSVDDIRNSTEVVYPPRNFDKAINWSRISHNFLCNKYSPEDCEIFWNIYLHPNINKSQWFSDENKKLKSIASKHHHQNWDAIAKELGNNRTGFVSCIHYHRNVEPPKEGRFSPAEDKLLCDLVKVFKQGNYIPWTRIAYHFKNRTRGQICYRYRYFLSCKNDIVKGKFTPAEDVLLMILVDKFGCRFSKCQEYFSNRCSVQLKARYTTNLKAAIKRASFTVEEDKQILDYVEKNGTTQWAALARMLSRTGGQVRQRYKIVNDFLKGHPDATLEDAPRRKGSVLTFDKEFDFLRCIANVYKNRNKIPTLKEIEKVLLSSKDKEPKKITINTNRNKTRKEIISLPQSHQHQEQIDDLLTDFFSAKIKVNSKKIDQTHINLVATTVRQCFSILQAELCIPKELKNIPELDDVDHRILKALTVKEAEIKRTQTEISSLLPPSLFNVAALWNLTNKNLFNTDEKANTSKAEKSQKTDAMLWCMRTYLSNVPETTRNKLKMERSLFYQRLLSVFKFPTILIKQKSSELCLFRAIPTTKSETYEIKSKTELSEPSTSRRTITDSATIQEDILEIEKTSINSSNEESREISYFKNIDDSLTDFFSPTSKLTHSSSIKPSHINDTANAIKNLLFAFRAELSIPKNLENISSLDPVDVQILTRLTSDEIINTDNKYVIKRNNLDVTSLVPPNLCTAIGMRNLMIKNCVLSGRMEANDLNKRQGTGIPEFSIKRFGDKHLFYQRLLSMLKFPTILTLQKAPPLHLLKTAVPNSAVRTYGKNMNRKIADKSTSSVPSTETITPLTQANIQKGGDLKKPIAQRKKVDSTNEESLDNFVSNIDDLLTDFFSSAMKLEFQRSINQAHVNHAVGSVQAILFMLDVELCIPKEFQDLANLDVVDVQILKSLTPKAPVNEDNEYVVKRSNLDIISQVPPNLYTAVGMRSLLIKNHIYKTTRKENNIKNRKNVQDNRYVASWGQIHPSKKVKLTQKQLKAERILFHKRLVSIFKFPGILTLQKPSDSLIKTLSSGTSKVAVRTYRKKTQPKGIKSNADEKESPVTNESMAEKLKRRINDTIKNLTTHPPAKRFCSSKTKTVSKQAKETNAEQPNTEEATPSPVPIETTENKVTEDVSVSADLEDLNALNEALNIENLDVDETFDIDD